MARLAAAQAGRVLGRPVRVVEYAVAPEGLTPLHGDASPAFSVTLDAAETAAKARSVAAYPDIEAEAAEIDRHEGLAGRGLERFHLPAPLGALLRPQAGGAYYERIGEARVAQGLYRTVLRARHVAAIARALMADTADLTAPRAHGAPAEGGFGDESRASRPAVC